MTENLHKKVFPPFEATLCTHLLNLRDPSLIHLKLIAYEKYRGGFVRDDRFLGCMGGRKQRRFITHFIRKSIFEWIAAASFPFFSLKFNVIPSESTCLIYTNLSIYGGWARDLWELNWSLAGYDFLLNSSWLNDLSIKSYVILIYWLKCLFMKLHFKGYSRSKKDALINEINPEWDELLVKAKPIHK